MFDNWTKESISYFWRNLWYLWIKVLFISEENEQVGNYEQTSIRYTGNHIPSPSFRVLQRFADEAQAYGNVVVWSLEQNFNHCHAFQLP